MRRESLLIAFVLITVFGISLAAAIPTAKAAPLFKVTIIAPGNANMVRRQWGQIIANSLQELGIDARLVFMGWAAVYDRVFTPALDKVGKTFDEGGYDLQLVGWTPGLIPNPRPLFLGDPGFFAPYGQNYYLYNSTKSNSLLNTFVTTTNSTIREKSMKDWQTVVYNDNPVSVLLYEKTVAVVNPRVSGYDWIYFNTGPTPQWLRKTGTNSKTVVYASTGEIESLIPPLSNSWYDTIILACVFNGLLEPNNARAFIPSLVKSYTASSDGHWWTLNLQPNVKWHTGWTFTADDVLYTLMALMNTQTGSQFVGYYTDVFGTDVKLQWVNGTTTRLIYDGSNTLLNPASIPSGLRQGNITALDANTVKIYLPNIAGLDKPYGYFYPETLAFANNVIPKHILERIPFGDWTTSPLNTGSGTLSITLSNGTAYTVKGPIGTGPYVFDSYDATAQSVHLKKFMGYWNRTALEAAGNFGIEDYYINFIADKTAALAALKNGQVDILDHNYHMTKDIPTIDSSWGKVFVLEGAGRQEIGFNMKHPILGTGKGTPLGTAEAARNVRLAIDSAIPRQLIIDNLLDGWGTPGVTPALPTQLYYNATLKPRPYDLAKAREYLKAAGYSVPTPAATPTYPSFFLGMNFYVTGTLYNFTGGSGKDATPAFDRIVEVRQTADNKTFETVATTKTDGLGRYSLIVTPAKTGKYSYYLNYYSTYPEEYLVPYGTPSIANSTLLRTLTVSSFSDTLSSATKPLSDQITALQTQMNTQISALQTQLNYLIVGLVVAIIIAILAIIMGRRG